MSLRGVGVTAKGFSIIELMVVLLMVVIITSGVTIAVGSLSSDKEKLYDAGRQLFAQMQFALDEALMQKHLVGLRVDANKAETASYHWYHYTDERWQPLGEPLKTVVLPKNIVLQISIDNELLEALLEKTLNDQSEDESVPPSIIFYPNGDISEFQLMMTLKENKEHSYQILIDERGQLTTSSLDHARGNIQ